MSTKIKKLESITITNKKILDYYSKNPHIDFESMSCLLIDLLENMKSDLSGALTNSITHDILNNVKDISNELSLYKNNQLFSNTQLQS